jgi:3-dehydroquinate dehydratase-2
LPLKLLVINGPNLNNLGKRDTAHYGTDTLETIEQELRRRADGLDCELEFFQSNHEGALIDFIQASADGADGILINPGALTHYGYSLRDALDDAGLPVVEVHLSDISQREAWRRVSVIADIAIKQISGLKAEGYYLGLETLVNYFPGGTGG